MKRSRQKTGKIRANTPLWHLGGKPTRRSSRLTWLRKFPFKIILLLLGIYIAYEILTFPFLSLAQLSTQNPSETAVMRQRIEEAREKGKVLKVDYRWTALTNVPRHVRKAILVSEDGTFYSHAGIDWHEVWESAETNWEKKRIVRGGSTITQQLAKNLYLSTSRDPIRKAKELLITWIMEMTLSKKRILELYLNIIEWGPGVFGIEAAAQRYFHKPASGLSTEEGARLAAVIPSPLRHKPTETSSYVEKKTDLILRRMAVR